MAKEDDNNVIISIDLDDSKVSKKFDGIRKDADSTAQSIESSFGSKINKPIDSLNIKINSARYKMLDFLEAIERLINIGSSLATVVSVLGNHFDFIQKAIGKVDKKFKRAFSAASDFIELLIEFIKSPSKNNFKALVGPIIELAKTFGLADDVLRILLSNMDKLIGFIGTSAFIVSAMLPLNDLFKKLSVSIASVSTASLLLLKDFRGLLKIIPAIGIFLGKSTKSLFGLTSSLAGAGLLLTTFGSSLKESTNNTVKFTGIGIATLGLALTGMSALMGFAIIKTSELAYVIGTRLVNVFKKSTDKFIKLEKSMVVFNKTIENYNRLSHGAVGTTESWTQSVESLSDQFNVSRNALRKSANEIVSVTSKLGLNEDQMKSLLKVSTEYAKINGKDLFQTTVNLVSALNGNGQAVQSLGIKMSQAANTSFALKKGIEKSFSSMSEGRKVAVRFNSLMNQYNGIVGIAAATSGTLAEQGERLKVNQERLNESIGAGAAIIENNNLVAFAMNKVINNIGDTVLKITGFFGAFGARILQIGGFILGLSFKIFALIKVLKILDIILKNEATQSLFGRSIPLLGKSVNRLIEDLVGAKIEIKSVSDVVGVSGKAIPRAINNISNALFGVSSASLTLGTAIKGAFGQFINGVKLALPFLKTFASLFAPIAFTIGLVVGAFLALKKSFREIEKRTGAFTDLYAIMVDVINESGGIFDDITNFVKEMGSVIVSVADVAFGLLITSVIGLVRILTELAAQNPFNVFSKDTVNRITSVNRNLDNLSASLLDSKFSVIALGEEGSRSIASIGESIKSVNVNDLKRLKEALADVGKSDLEKITQERDERLQLIRDGYSQELLSLTQFENLKLKIKKDFAIKEAALQAKHVTRQQQLAKDIALASRTALGQGISNSFAAFGSALAKGENALESFGKTALNALGGFMIQLGTLTIAAGVASTQLGISLASFNGAGAIAAGAALVAVGAAVQSMSGGPGEQGTPTNPTSVSPVETTDSVGDVAAAQEKQQAVVINIEGQILDPVGTATQIAELLSDVTNSNDILVNA